MIGLCSTSEDAGAVDAAFALWHATIRAGSATLGSFLGEDLVKRLGNTQN